MVVTGDGDEHLDATALTRTLSTFESDIDVVVIVGETRPPEIEPFTTVARAGGIAVRGEPSVDAVKRIREGLVIATLDRSRVVRPRLPLGASPTALAEGLTAVLSGGAPHRRVRIADLVACFDPAAIAFV